MANSDNEELYCKLRMIHRQMSSILKMTGVLLFCVIGGWIVVADKDITAYLVFLLFTLLISFYHIDRIGYVLIKYFLYNNCEIRYVFGKNYEDFVENIDDMQ
jgi:hypothetical protein